jgi:hypothetical protein
MIISENNKPSIEDFKAVMRKTDCILNSDAATKEAYYVGRNGTLLEIDVYDAVREATKNTVFENTIQLVSGASFPDIVANQFFGIEVKSTNKNYWHSVGSSILESTRDKNVERIFLTFGKLGRPVEFKTRPYEECLAGISVTHYPRYQINMELPKGETIFDKMGISYDELRSMENPVSPVAKYYKSQLKAGESLWWASDENIEETVAPATVRLWNTLSAESKNHYTIQGYALFPEILSNSSNKYHRYALWLATNCGVINTNIRDQFSAGGKKDIYTMHGKFEKMPAAFFRIAQYKDWIVEIILTTSETMLKEWWQVRELAENRLAQWCQLVATQADDNIGYMTAYRLLRSIFNI